MAIDLPRSGWLPKTWKELSRGGDENGMFIKIAHISPWTKADKRMIAAGSLIESRGNYSKVARGVRTSSGMTTNVTGVYDGMQEMARMGLMPGYSEANVLKLRKDTAEKLMPEDCDFQATVVIASCGDKQTAMLNLDNMAAVSSGGFGAMQIPGAPNGLASVFDNPMVRARMTPEQMAQIDEFKKRLPNIDAQLKAANAASGMTTVKETLLGHPAVCQQVKGTKHYTGMVVGNYMISGDFLGSMEQFLPGSTGCDSLTKFKSVITREKIGTETFTTEEMIPLESTLAAEGFLNRDEFEGILKTVIKAVPHK